MKSHDKHTQCTEQQLFTLYREHVEQSVDRIQSHSDSLHRHRHHIKRERNQRIKSNDSKMDIDDEDDGEDINVSVPFNVNKQSFNDWTRSLCTISSNERATAIKRHFTAIWKWLTTEKCFVVERDHSAIGAVDTLRSDSNAVTI